MEVEAFLEGLGVSGGDGDGYAESPQALPPAPVRRASGSGSGGSAVEDTVLRDILEATGLLQRPTGRGADSSAAPVRAGTTSAAAGAGGGAVPNISEARRKEILAQLASERAERRGFASEREQSLAAHKAATAVTGAKEESQTGSGGSGSGSGSGSSGSGSGSGLASAVHSATTQAVSSAISKAFSSIGIKQPAGVPQQPPPTASPPPSAASTMASSGTARPVPPLGLTADPAPSSSFRSGHSKEERELLVARLLAERRAKVGQAASSSSSSAGSSSTAAALAASYSAPHFALKASAIFSAAVEATLTGTASATGSSLLSSASEAEASGPGRPGSLSTSSSSSSSASVLMPPAIEAAFAARASRSATLSSSAAPAAGASSPLASSSSSSHHMDTLHHTHGQDSEGVLRALRAQVTARFGAKGGIAAPSSSSGGGGGSSTQRVTFAKSPLPSPPTAKTPRHSQAAPPPPPTSAPLASSASASSSAAGTAAGKGGPSPKAAAAARRSASGSRAAAGSNQPRPRSISPSAAAAAAAASATAAAAATATATVASAARLAALAKDKSKVYAERERFKAEEQAEEVAATCTFQPNTAGGGLEQQQQQYHQQHQDQQQQQQHAGPATSYSTSSAREYLEGGVGMPLGVMVDAASAIGGTAAPPPSPGKALKLRGQLEQQRQPAQKQAQAQAQQATRKPPAPTSSATSGSVSVVQRLYEEADRRALKQAQAKAAVERAAGSAFTFKPVINPKSRLLVEEKGAAAQQAQAQLAQGAAGYLAVGGWGGGGGTGAGAGAGAAAAAHVPLFQRSEAVARESAEALHRLRLEAMSLGSNAQCTFQPRINPKSAAIAAAKAAAEAAAAAAGGGSGGGGGGGGGWATGASSSAPLDDIAPDAAAGGSGAGGVGGVTERLTQEAARRQAKLQALQMATAAQQASQCTFQPHINSEVTEDLLRARLSRLEGGGHLHSSSSSSSSGAESHLPPTSSSSAAAAALHSKDPHSRFLARAALTAAAEAAAARAASAAHGASQGFTFTPDIGNAEEVLAVMRPDRAGESRAQGLQRLAVGEAAARRAALEAKQKEAEAALSFRPTINAHSRALGRAHSLEELAANETGARAQLRAQALAQAEFEAKHPFRPAPAASSASASNEASEPLAPLPERCAEAKAVAEARLEELRRQAEYAELQACTFAPATGASRASLARLKEAAAGSGGVVVVRGLGRHLELRELSRQIEEERREREEAAFAVRGTGVWGEERGPTIPQPFHFATSERGGEGAAAAAAAAAGEAGSGARSQKELLRMILEEGGEEEAVEEEGEGGLGGSRQQAPASALSPQNITIGLGGWGEGGGVDITRFGAKA